MIVKIQLSFAVIVKNAFTWLREACARIRFGAFTHKLSGGQKQRLELWRDFYCGADTVRADTSSHPCRPANSTDSTDVMSQQTTHQQPQRLRPITAELLNVSLIKWKELRWSRTRRWLHHTTSQRQVPQQQQSYKHVQSLLHLDTFRPSDGALRSSSASVSSRWMWTKTKDSKLTMVPVISGSPHHADVCLSVFF